MLNLNISKFISENKIFIKKPILVMHIGSAGSNFKIWKNISQNSTLVSIDGNDSNSKKNKFKKVINNKTVISNKMDLINFISLEIQIAQVYLNQIKGV